MLNNGAYEVVSMLHYTGLCGMLPDFRPCRCIRMAPSESSSRALDSVQYLVCDDSEREIRREQSGGERVCSLPGHRALEVFQN